MAGSSTTNVPSASVPVELLGHAFEGSRKVTRRFSLADIAAVLGSGGGGGGTSSEVLEALAALEAGKATLAQLEAEAEFRYGADVDLTNALSDTNQKLATSVSEITLARGGLDSLDARLDNQDIRVNGLLPGARERPGDRRALFTSELSGPAESRAPVTFGTIVNNAEGAALRVVGVGTPQIVASIQDFAVEPGQVYAARLAATRVTNTSDPFGDAVEFRLACLDKDKGYIATLLIDKRALTVADGRFSTQATFSRDQEADITVPAATRYVRPYVRLLGGDGVTDIEVIYRWESIGLPGGKGDVGREPEYELNTEVDQIRWRQANGTWGPWLDVGYARQIAEQKAAEASASASEALAAKLASEAASEASGDVLFFDAKADATAALSGTAEGQIVEVFVDESMSSLRTRYRVQAGALVFKLIMDPRPSLTGLSLLRAIPQARLYTGLCYYLADPRVGGWLKWSFGDLSEKITADPFAGIWVAPDFDPTGSAGAWERMVEKNVFDGEWWLPDVMPTNAQVRLNAGILAVPGNCGKFIMPRREVLRTDQLILAKGLTYEGHGPSAPINGGGSAQHCVVVAASNARVVNIHARNVAGGQIGLGEPSGFHIFDGRPIWTGDGTPIENVSIINCSADTTETGIRVGYNGTTEGATNVVFGARDTYIENFRCRNINGIGIEAMRAHNVEVVGGTVSLKPYNAGGLRRCFRLVGCHDIHAVGTKMIGPDNGTVIGVSLEEAGNGTSVSGATGIVVEGLRAENLRTVIRVADDCHVLTVANLIAKCRQEEFYSEFISVVGGAIDDRAPRAIKLIGNQALNVATFVDLQGRVRGITVENNTHISNAASNARFLNTQGSAPSIEQGKFTGNKSYLKSAGLTGGAVRLAALTVASDVTFDDNEFTPDSTGTVFAVTGDGTFRTKRLSSNTTLSTTLWAQMRPDLAQEVYV
jgi:hypothetical protein